MTPRHIGIVACSAEGAALCYRTICVEGAAILGLHAHPEVMVHTFSLADYMAFIYRDDWASVGELMLAYANKLKAVGADFLICPDNTIHQALPYVVQRSPLPCLHIAEEVASENQSDLTGSNCPVPMGGQSSGGCATRFPSA
jgi:aspartate racemase